MACIKQIANYVWVHSPVDSEVSYKEHDDGSVITWKVYNSIVVKTFVPKDLKGTPETIGLRIALAHQVIDEFMTFFNRVKKVIDVIGSPYRSVYAKFHVDKNDCTVIVDTTAKGKVEFAIPHATMKALSEKDRGEDFPFQIEASFYAWRILQDVYRKWTGKYLSKSDMGNCDGPALI